MTTNEDSEVSFFKNLARKAAEEAANDICIEHLDAELIYNKPIQETLEPIILRAINEATAERDAEIARLREALEQIEKELVNLQPKIPQACKAGYESFIDTYVDSAIAIAQSARKPKETE